MRGGTETTENALLRCPARQYARGSFPKILDFKSAWYGATAKFVRRTLTAYPRRSSGVLAFGILGREAGGSRKRLTAQSSSAEAVSNFASGLFRTFDSTEVCAPCCDDGFEGGAVWFG